MINKPIWIIDDVLLERHDSVGFPTLADAGLELGHEIFRTKYIPFTDSISDDLKKYLNQIDKNIPVIAYGCIGFLKQIYKNFSFKSMCPGAYYKTPELKYSYYCHQFGDDMLNSDFIMLPYGEIERRGSSFFGPRFFIRPDVVTKSFAGRVINFDDFAENPKALSQYEVIDKSEICVIASPKEITCESRHLIVNKKVVTQSTYRYLDKLYIIPDVLQEMKDFAELKAKEAYNPDYVYIMDLAMTSNGVKIVEFNTFSCAGLYGMDTRKVIESVSEMAWKEFLSDLD